MGESGSGKSTIVQMVQRLYDPVVRRPAVALTLASCFSPSFFLLLAPPPSSVFVVTVFTRAAFAPSFLPLWAVTHNHRSGVMCTFVRTLSPVAVSHTCVLQCACRLVTCLWTAFP